MPELPEVEGLRRSLEPLVLGATVSGVTLRRRDVVCRPGDPPGGWSRRPRSGPHAPQNGRPGRMSRVPKAELLLDQRLERLERRGKALAILTDQRALLVHLGMTGQVIFREPGRRLDATDHVHIVWRLMKGRADAGRLVFRDPRRFGGVWTVPGPDALYEQHFDRLGPDALTVDEDELAGRLARADRPIKAALLDQSVLAGVGNIYADEALHAARISPVRRAKSLRRAEVVRLAIELRAVLAAAIDAGGTTLRDYRRGDGTRGSYRAHRVYGRGGLPCLTCGGVLEASVVAQRTTVSCPVCQPAG